MHVDKFFRISKKWFRGVRNENGSREKGCLQIRFALLKGFLPYKMKFLPTATRICLDKIIYWVTILINNFEFCCNIVWNKYLVRLFWSSEVENDELYLGWILPKFDLLSWHLRLDLFWYIRKYPLQWYCDKY